MFEEAAARARRREDTRPVLAAPAALAAAGGAIIVLALFLPWFSASREGIELPGISTGWQWLGVLDVVLFATALLGVAAAVRPDDPWLPSLAAYAAAPCVIAVLARMVNPPNVTRFILEYQVKAGPFVALLGLALVLLGTVAKVRLP